MKTGSTTGTRHTRTGLRLLVFLTSIICSIGLLASSGEAAVSSAPSVVNASASNVTYSSAILHDEVNPHGQVTNFFFQYGTTSAYGAQTPLAPAGNGTITISVSQAVTGLQPGTIYHYRVMAVSSGGHDDRSGPHLHHGQGPALGSDRQHAEPGGVR